METSATTTSQTLFDKVQYILRNPKDCWPTLKSEQTSIEALYRSWVVPLAAIGPACALIGGVLSGYFFSSLLSALIGYGLSLAGVYVASWIVKKVAELFGGTALQVNTFKLVAYSAVPVYLAAATNILPGLTALLALPITFAALIYSIYLFYAGSVQMVEIAPEKKLAFVAACFAAFFILGFVMITFAGCLACGAISSV